MSQDEKGICPVGGDWYTCTAQSPTFFGCCISNPCRGDNRGCPTSNLRAAGIGSGTNPDTTENGTYFPNTQCAKGLWWTCDVPQRPTFQGCCEVNPCNGVGCPAGSLQPAAFKTIPSELSPTATSASSSSILSATQTSNSTPLPKNTSSGANIGAIAGGVGGGLAILLIGLTILWFCRRRRHKQSVAGAYLAGASEHSPINESKSQKPNRYSLLGMPISKKYIPVSLSSPPLSPGPPPYQSPQQSPNPNVHEIDSTHLHEVADDVPPTAAVQALRRGPMAHELDTPTAKPIMQSVNEVVGVPNPAQESRWATRPTGMAIVEIGDGTPQGRAASPVSAMQSPNLNQRESTVSHDSPRSTFVIGMARPNENEIHQEGQQGFVGWQNLKP
ncbi:hypothetical protein ONS95_012139 [Cadophora gregata]|uniref:uncharacterized protein n=1 Tax=Cadophora gregata TaxID=51156 RepID=UPI0026DB47E8|nr:uncharacterized protein ONS95_012139 [Cadophora gregata]KAK0117814.1 hypothetical protein ONS95_012139 [Cadophora gregata]KAK0122868.1 hypothetical protein ONS96_009895 [Cadophora gregata f. sp. sojae]